MAKKLMALALAGASMLACGQAQAALVIEFHGTAAMTSYTQRVGQPSPMIESGLNGGFSGVFQAFYMGTGYGLEAGPGGLRQLGPTSYFNFKIDGLPVYVTEATNGWIALPGTGTMNFTIGNPITGNFTIFYGPITSASYRVYDDPSFTSYKFTAAVPEPTTWAMMIAGFGIAGAALRQRRRVAHAFG